MVEADIHQAFLIGLHNAAEKGKPVFIMPPDEWDLDEWLAQRDIPELYFKGATNRDIVWRQDGNLYGRRTAGADIPDALSTDLGEPSTQRFPPRDWH
jgi:hypothetical protein